MLCYDLNNNLFSPRALNGQCSYFCFVLHISINQLGKPVYTLMRALEHAQPDLLASKTVKVNREKKE